MYMYVVGGAVRDALFGRKPKDIDVVVTGTTEEALLTTFGEDNMKRVGKAFPVFLYKDKIEIALARRESSTGAGYSDFSVNTEGVEIYEDLDRRDFTVNALAIEVSRVYGTWQLDEALEVPERAIYSHAMAMQDIKNRVLRINNYDHFGEDPLRVLRGLRLAARHDLTIDAYTEAHMRRMVAEGCLDALPKERIWKEFEQAAKAVNFHKFIYLLGQYDCFPELSSMFQTPQPIEYHPEGDVMEHTALALQHYTEYERAQYNWDDEQHVINLFSVLCHDMGKSTAYKAQGNLHGHEKLTENAEAFLGKIGAPRKVCKAALFCAQEHHRVHGLFERNPNRIATWLVDNSEFSDKVVVNALLMTCVSDANARLKPVRYLQMNMLAELVMNTRKLPDSVRLQFTEGMSLPAKKQLMHRGFIAIVTDIKERYLNIEESV